MQVLKTAKKYGIGCLDWPEEFPYKPEVSLEISYDDDLLHLLFCVEEKATVARCRTDKEEVWTDSCVEFFFAPSDDGLYYNIECNPTGRIYMCCGPDRAHREFLPRSAYDGIVRTPSLGTEPFELREVAEKWSVGLDIPASTFVHHRLQSFRSLSAKGNFYKCGNVLGEKHYLSFFPVRTSRPDFHRPEFFGPIVFD